MDITVKFNPRKINLEPKDPALISNLADGEIVNDPTGVHTPGASLTINHGDLGLAKFPSLMFPAPNPVEFYLLSALRNLERIRELEPQVAVDNKKINYLLLEEFQFCIFAVCAIESFVNQMIPGDYEFIDGVDKISKLEIEQRWTLEEKIKKVISKISGVSIAGDSKVWQPFTSLTKLRDDIIHLKTTHPVVSDFRSYQDLYTRLLGNDYEESYKIVTQIVELIGTGTLAVKK